MGKTGKRGKSKAYRLTGSTYRLPPSMRSLAESRVLPFLGYAGLQTRSLVTLMVEAYMAGMKDAAEVYEQRNIS